MTSVLFTLQVPPTPFGEMGLKERTNLRFRQRTDDLKLEVGLTRGCRSRCRDLLGMDRRPQHAQGKTDNKTHGSPDTADGKGTTNVC